MPRLRGRRPRNRCTTRVGLRDRTQPKPAPIAFEIGTIPALMKKTRDNDQMTLAGTEEAEILGRLSERVEKAVGTIQVQDPSGQSKSAG